MKPEEQIIINTDGGSRGNPGYAAYGFVIKDADKKLMFEHGKNIGIQTNNVAEYTAIVEALRHVEQNMKPLPVAISFFMDSKLAVEQLSGRWKIKNENIRNLFYTVKQLEKIIGAEITYTYVPREENKDADRMVNAALDGLI